MLTKKNVWKATYQEVNSGYPWMVSMLFIYPFIYYLFSDFFFSLMNMYCLYMYMYIDNFTACGTLVPQPGIKDRPPSAMEVWGPNHWTAREFHIFFIYKYIYIYIYIYIFFFFF